MMDDLTVTIPERDIVSPRLGSSDGAQSWRPLPRPVDLKSVMREMWK